MIRAAILLCALLCAGCASAPRRYACSRTVDAILIDGVLDEATWRRAPRTPAFVDIAGRGKPRPRFATRAQLAWDDQHLYLAADLVEPHVSGSLTERDAVVYHDNDFEVFIDPDGDGENYVEIEVNALNTIFDLRLVKTYRNGGPALIDWDIPELRSAVRVDGTLNDPRDRDRGWCVEIAIPWSAFAEHTAAPVPPLAGDIWRMNMSRVEWRYRIVDGEYEKIPGTREDNWVWSPQGEIDMHLPARWGYVTFVE